jgi:hypothetical protein
MSLLVMPMHCQINRLIGLMGAGDAIGQGFQGVERGDIRPQSSS